MPWRAFVPLPWPGLHFWNTNLLDAWPSLQAVAGVLTLALAAALLWPRKVALATFGLGAAGFLAFGYVKYVGVGGTTATCGSSSRRRSGWAAASDSRKTAGPGAPGPC